MEDREFAQEMLMQCVAGRTHQVARIVSARYDQALKEFGLTSNQLTLLCLVATLEPVRPSDMLPYLRMEQSTLSRNLERLVDRGLLERREDEADSRSVQMVLTKAGSQTLRAARDGWDRAQEWAVEALGQSGVEELSLTARRLNPLMP
ncbi:MAG: MarR family winged helix-turn-helix transcriptional regulator [Erythrobacter sp.]